MSVRKEICDTEAYKRLEAAHIVEFEERFRITVQTAYYTPDYVLEAIRAVMGEIDLDPASCECAQRRVKAKAFYDKESNGLAQPWHGRVYLNPNYDFTEFALFLDKAVEEWEAGNMTECIISAETSVTWHNSFQRVLQFADAYCFVNHRVRWTPAWDGFEYELAEIGYDISQVEPYSKHGSAFAYKGPNTVRFTEVFREFGTVLQQVP